MITNFIVLFRSDERSDFERVLIATIATTRRDSACAVGLAAGCDGRVILTRTYLIRPPTAQFTFTDLHGLDWEDVHDAPTFAELWPTLRAWIDAAAFVAAHNAPFDRSVLHACCARYRLRPTRTPFTCTVQLARTQWGIRPTKLPDVCRRLRIPLSHHDAGADALACARIVLAAEADGWLPGRRRTHRTATRAIVRLAPPVSRARSTSLLRWPAFVRLLQTWWQRLWKRPNLLPRTSQHAETPELAAELFGQNEAAAIASACSRRCNRSRLRSHHSDQTTKTHEQPDVGDGFSHLRFPILSTRVDAASAACRRARRSAAEPCRRARPCHGC